MSALDEMVRRYNEILELQFNMIEKFNGILNRMNERIEKLEEKSGMIEESKK